MPGNIYYLYKIIYCAEKRQWFNLPYDSDIWKLCPDRFQSSYARVPGKLYEAFEIYTFVERAVKDRQERQTS